MIDVKKTLIDKYKKSILGNFYILKTSRTFAPADFLAEWMNDFLQDVICLEKKINNKDDAKRIIQNGHGDILIIKKDEPDKEYLLKDGHFDEFYRFQNFDRLEFSWRFIVIHDAHKISKIISNKLLKSLERPPQNTTVFFLHPTRQKMLPTITSRALTLLINDTSNDYQKSLETRFYTRKEMKEWFQKNIQTEPTNLKNIPARFFLSKNVKDAIIKYIETKTEISNILDLIKTNKSEMNSFFTILLNWESSHLSNYRQKKTILDEIKWFKTASTYNNMPSERFFALIETTLGN